MVNATPEPKPADLKRQVELPKTVPLPGLANWREEQEAAAKAEEAAWQKRLADFEAARAKAEAEGKEAPKAPVRVPAKQEEGDLCTPRPKEAEDPDLLRLAELLGDKVEEAFEQAGELTCQVGREHLLEALRLCREEPRLKYEMLADMTGTHYPAAKGFAFSLVYHLVSLHRCKRLRLRILVPEGFAPESATQVYPGANWMEREVYDMLGVRFLHHPDMTRILCPEDWEGHALRKEYPVVGLGQRDIDLREDRSGVLNRRAVETAGHLALNLKPPTAE